MPDLTQESVHAFWDNYDRRTLYRIVVALEHVESWVIENNPEIALALVRLGQALDRIKTFDLREEASLIRLLIGLHTGQALRILQALDMIKPGTAAQLLMYAEETGGEGKGKTPNPQAKVFLRRNLVFERLQLLSRIFGPQRLSLALKALESNVS
jgi:intracellular multiplication protein IcmW